MLLKKRYLAVVINSICIGAVSSIAHAETPISAEKTYAIQANQLGYVLANFAAQTGTVLVFDSSLTANLSSNGLSGNYSFEQGLQKLLSNTPLIYEKLSDGSYKIVKKQPAQQTVQTTAGVATSADAPDAIQLTPIVVEASADKSIFNNPTSATSVNRERLDRVTPTSASDMFKGIPGVQMANSRSGISIEPNVRGAQGQGRVKVLMDGAEASTASRVTYAGNRSHSYIDQDFVNTIDVEKGGNIESGALGGTVSMKTFDAKDLIVDPNKNWGLRIKGMLGNNSDNQAQDGLKQCGYQRVYTDPSKPSKWTDDTTPRATSIDYCNNNTAVTNRAGTYTSYYQYRDVTKEELNIPSYSGQNYSGSVIGAWMPMDNLEFVAGYSQRVGGNYSAGKNGGLDPAFPTNGGYWFDGRERIGFSYWEPGTEVYGSASETETWLLKGKYSLGNHQIGLQYNQLKSDFVQQVNVNPQMWPSVSALYTPWNNVEQKRYNVDYKYTPSNPWISLKANAYYSDINEHSWTEIDFKTQYADVNTKIKGANLSNISQLNVFNMPLTLKVGANYKEDEASGDTEVNGVKKTELGSFLQAKLNLTDWLVADAGMRYDSYKADIDSANNSYRFGEDNEDHDTTYQYGLTLLPMKGLQVFARYNEGWRAPSSRELTMDNCAAGFGYVSSPTKNNPDRVLWQCLGAGLIKPEESTTIEYGFNLDYQDVLFGADKFGLKAVRFDNSMQNYLYGSGTSFLPYHNIKDVTYKGYELSLSYSTPWAFLEYAHTRYDQQKFCGLSSQTPVNCTNKTGLGGLGSIYAPATQTDFITVGTTLFDQALTVGVNMNFVQGTGYQFNGLNEYEVYDLFAKYKVNKNLDLGLSIENLKDVYYFDAGTDYMSSIPSPGRTTRATVTYKF